MNRNIESKESSAGVPNISIPVPVFPALSFSQGLVTVIDSLDRISCCTKLGFKKGYYKGLFLVDSKGMRLNVVDAKKIRRLPFAFRFKDFLELISGNPRWQVELIFAPHAQQTSLSDIKKLIFDSFKKEHYLWEEMSDFEGFRDKLTQAESMQRVFAIFKEFNQW